MFTSHGIGERGNRIIIMLLWFGNMFHMNRKKKYGDLVWKYVPHEQEREISLFSFGAEILYIKYINISNFRGKTSHMSYVMHASYVFDIYSIHL